MKYTSLICLSLLSLAPLTWSSEETIKPYRYADLLVNEETVLPEPMDTTGLSQKVSDTLQSYYSKSLGGPKNWQKIKSLRIRGQLIYTNGKSYKFAIFRKKPDLNKSVVYLDNKCKIVTCFDGVEAWQVMTSESETAKTMPLDDSIDFIRDSWLGGHLLSPLLPGKTTEILEAINIDGKTCIQVKVTLPNQQYYLYALDSNRYPVAEESVSAVDGSKRYVKQSDFRNVSGLMIPFRSKVYSDGVLIQEAVLESVVVNKGVMPWMFKRPQQRTMLLN